MKRSLIPAVVLVLAAHLLGQVSETTVRLAYAKATFANQVGLIEKNIQFGDTTPSSKLASILQQNELSFVLSDFKSDDVVGNRAPMLSLTTLLYGKQVLNFSTQIRTFGKDPATETSIRINWHTAPNIIAGKEEEAAKFTIGDFVTLANPGTTLWTHFLTYNVVATYQGKRVVYKSAVLFDDTGKLEDHDPFIEGVGNLANTDVYPVLLLKHLADNPSVAEWVKANTAPADAATKPGEISCDLDTIKCLLPPDAMVGTGSDPVGTR